MFAGPSFGRILLLMGILFIVAGVIFMVAGRIPYLGRLPGDFRVERENVKVYFPLTTSLLISAFLTLMFWLFSRMGR